jgi:glucose-6-phosphate isomerase
MQQILPRINPTETLAWKQLTQHAATFRGEGSPTLKSLFIAEPKRGEQWCMEVEGWYLDYSKNLLDARGLAYLRQLAEECRVQEGMEAMFSGAAINETEGRAVLHTALRDPSSSIRLEDGSVPGELVQEVLQRMENFVNGILDGTLRGCTGKVFTDVVNIGIGGSDLGPLMVCEALASYRNSLGIHFVSNVDGAHLQRTLHNLDPETTLFLVASKTFTTQETMANALSARAWFTDRMEAALDQRNTASQASSSGVQGGVHLHFVALSTNTHAVNAFGISLERMFPFWDWVGGRYSLWSAIGLSVALAVGFENFKALLAGAHAMDKHFRHTPWEQNLPITLALVGIWNRNFMGMDTLAILPYDQCLSRFPAYLQQADMESNGKSVDRQGLPLTYESGPVLWGEPGTNGQHAFYQLIHQGTSKVACDFILPARSRYPVGSHHRYLTANALAQAQALMQGRNREQVLKASSAAGRPDDLSQRLLPFQLFEGNRPSNFLMCQTLSPYALGSLIATYEHKIFVQGLIWNIYSFDQWGVELGKVLANRLLPLIEGGDMEAGVDLDSSTSTLLKRWQSWQKDGGI